MAVESALLFGSPTTEDLLEVSFGEPQRAGRGRVTVPLLVQVPLDQLTFLPTDTGLRASTELRLALVDENGNRSDIPAVPLLFDVNQPPPAGVFGRYGTMLKMRRLGHRVVIAIHDLASGRILSADAELDY